MKEESTHTEIGTVVTGRGIGQNRMRSLTNFFTEQQLQFFPGTLNVLLENPIGLDRSKAAFNYNNEFYFWNIQLNGIPCYAYRWTQCPLHVIEVISENKLRDVLQLDTTNLVEVSIATNLLQPLRTSQKIAWNFSWSGRRTWYYTSDSYNFVLGKWDNLMYYVKALFKSKKPVS